MSTVEIMETLYNFYDCAQGMAACIIGRQFSVNMLYTVVLH